MASDLQIVIRALNQASGELRKVSRDIKGLQKEAAATGGVDKLNKSFNVGLASALKFGAGLAGIQTGLVAFEAGVKGTVGAAISFEESFAGIRKTVDGTEEDFARLAQGNRDMAKTLPLSVNAINALGEAAGQLGVTGVDNILKFERVVADVGNTTNLTADEAATAFAQIANVAGLPIQQVDRLGAAIVDLGNKGASTEKDIVDFAQRIAGAGKIAGLSVAEIAGVGSAFASVGVEAEAGGTAIQKVLIEMTRAAAQGGDALRAFSLTAGLTVDQFKSLIEENPAEAFTLFVEGLGKAGDDAFKILETLGLEDQRLIRSFLSVASAGDLLRRSIQTGSTAFANNTALATEAEKRYATTAAKLQILRNNFADVGITIGQQVIPPIAEFSEAIIHNMPAIIGGMETFGGVALDTAESLQEIVDTVSDLIGVSSELAPVIAASVVAFAAFTPGGAIIAGLILISGAIAVLQTDLSTASDEVLSFEEAWFRAEIGILNVISEIENAIVAGILKPVNLAIDAINSLGNVGDALGITIDDIPNIQVEDIGENAADRAIRVVEERIKKLQEERDRRRVEAGDLLGIEAAKREALLGDQGIPKVPAFDFEFPDFAKAAGGLSRLEKVLNAVSDGAIDLSEALELGLSDQEVVALELAHAEGEAANEAYRARIGLLALSTALGRSGLTTEAFQLQLALSAIAENLRETNRTASEFRLAEQVGPELDRLRSRLQEVLGSATKEDLQLSLQRNELEKKRLLLLSGGGKDDDKRVKAIDAEIKNLDNLIRLRELEVDQLRIKSQLADQTILSDQAQLQQTGLLTGALGLVSTEATNLTSVIGLESWARLNLINAINEEAAALRGTGEVPSFASGVRNFGGGLAKVHKDEIIGLPRGSDVFTASESQRLLSAGTPAPTFTTYVTVEGDATERTVALIKKAVREEAETALRRASFRGSYVTSGAYTPA